MRRFIFTVKGSGNFPFGMLARDECFPVNESEALKIYDACPTVAPEQSITLTSQSRPTVEAWRELKWPITRVE